MSDTFLQKELYKKILAKLKSSVDDVKNLNNLSSYEQESIGGFAWFWNLSGDTNLTTYNLMNNAAAYDPDTGAIKATATSATNTALAVYQALQYRLSKSDNTAVNQAETRAVTQAKNVVTAWNKACQPLITSAEMKASGVNTPADYVISQFLNVYSGGAGKVKWADFTSSGNPASLFPDMPPSLDSVLNAVVQYAEILNDVGTIKNNEMSANWLKNKLVAAIQTPTVANGAIMTKDPISGNTATQCSWQVQQSTSDLRSILNGTEAFSVKIKATKSQAGSVRVSVDDGGWLDGAIDFISFFGGGSASYNSFSTEGTGTSVDIELTYKGVGVANFAPLQFNQSTLQGWYDQKVIAEAYLNRKVTGSERPAKSGYILSGLNPTYKLGKDGNAGYINAAVFSNPPAVKMTYADGNYSTFQSQFKEESSWGVGLFGIKLFGGSQTYEKAIHQAEGTSGGFSISFPPKSITSGGTAAGAQLADVVAVNPEWMGDAS